MRSRVTLLTAAIMVSAACISTYEQTPFVISDFADLGKEGLQIAACDPTHCPAGRYTYLMVSTLETSNPELAMRIRKNILTNDMNVRAVLDKVVTGEVDAGFVYLTDAQTVQEKVQVIDIPIDYTPLPQYAMSAIQGSPNTAEALLFIDFMTSEEGQNMLKKHGFLAAEEDTNKPPVKLDTMVMAENMKGRSITIYAAASLTNVLSEAADVFHEKTGIEVVLGFGSSGTLRQKIEAGAPADIYASASIQHVDMLIKEGFIPDYTIFARNRLVVVTLG